MSQPVPPKRPNSEKSDPLLETFLHRAAPVIAMERGLTDSARIKIEAIAQDMKLPRESFAKGMEMLQGDPPVGKQKLSRWEKAFDKSMRAKIKKIPRGIMTSAIEAKAVQVGQEKYQLSELQARELLRTILSELNIQRVSVSQAEQHVETMVRELVGDSTYVDPSGRERLIEAGKQWGVSKNHVESLTDVYIENNLQGQQRQRQFMTTVIGVGVVLVVAFLGGMIFVLNRPKGPPEDSTVKGAGSPKVTSKSDSAQAKFWDEQTALAIVKTRLKIPKSNSAIKLMASESAEDRGEGYQEIWKVLGNSKFDSAHQQRIEGLSTGLLKCEPSDELANQYVDGLFSFLQLKTIPTDGMKFLTRGRSVVRIGAKLSTTKTIPIERRQYIHQKLSNITNVDFSDGASRALLSKRYGAGFFQSLMTKLASMAADNPLPVIKFYMLIANQTISGLSESKRIRTDTSFLVASIPYANEHWTLMKPLIQKCIDNGDSDQIVRFIQLYEFAGNPDAQRFIGGELLNMTGLIPDSTDPADIANAIRKRLGVTEKPKKFDAKTASRQLKLQFEKFERDANSVSGDRGELAEKVAQAAFYATLFQEFSRNSESINVEEELKKIPDFSAPAESEEEVDEDEPEMGSEERRVSDETFQRYLRPVTKYKPYKIQARVQALQSLSIIAKQFNDVTSEQARGMAEYLFARKNQPEHEEVVKAVSHFSHWPRLLVAVSDHLEQSRLEPEEERAVVEAILGDTISAINTASFRSAAQRELFGLSLSRIEQNLIPDSDDEAAEEAELLETFLQQTYLKRAALSRATGISPDASVSEIAEGWLRKLFLKTKTTEENRRDLMAAKLLSQNDIESTVTLQRILIDKIGELSVRSRPTSSDRVQQIIIQSNEEFSRADSILSQLLINELTMGKLWLEGTESE